MKYCKIIRKESSHPRFRLHAAPLHCP